MKHYTRLQKWATGFVVAATAVAGLAMAPSAHAVEDVIVNRLAGDDRYETAAAVAETAYPSGSQSVIVASGRTFPDALAGAALAGAVDAPLLLTDRDQVPAATSQAISDLGARTVYVLGGTATISESTAQSLGGTNRQVRRIAGDDRFETAAEIASEIGADSVGSLTGRRTAIVATGRDFADALAGGPIAGAGDGTGVHPILLVDSSVPEATEAAITELDIEQVVILGGTSAVSTPVERELETLTGNDAVRIAGTDRFATAVAVARAAVQRFRFSFEEVLLANGFNFADALAGGPLGAVRLAPIALTSTSALPAPTRNLLESESATVETITVLGGTAAVSDQVAQAAEAAAETDPARPANESILVSPASSEEQANGSTREYTATGLGATPVDVVLVECADVTLVGGETRLPNANGNTVADGTAQAGTEPDLAGVENVRIASVNGTARQAGDPTITNDDYANNVVPTDGSITFSVAGPAASSTATVCVVPVVFVDANVDNALNGTTANPTDPSEDFGTGGRTTFSASGAPAGQFAIQTVTATAKASDQFTGCVPGPTPLSPQECRTFGYDANDTFQVDSQPTTFADFERRLSVGDNVRGTYAPEPSGTSTFNLSDATPAPPTNVAATATGTTVRVTFTDSATPTVDLYRLYRDTRTGASCADFNTTAGRSDYSFIPAQASTIEGQPDQGETADTGNASPPVTPAPTYTIADRTAAPNTTYCYVVVSVDKENAGDANGDESIGSAPATATTGTAQTIVTNAEATSADGVLGVGDELRLTFGPGVTVNPIDGTLADNPGVTVEGANPIGATEEDLTCGPAGASRATCTYNSTTRVLTMTIAGATTQQYPLTLVDVFGVSPEVDLANSDTNIQRVS